MYQKADPASIKKIRRKCATVAPISPLRPPGEPSPTRQRGKNPKKYGANAPQLHPISYLSRTNPGKTKKYGANAPQLHAIRCSIDFCVMLCNEQAKKQKNTAQMRHSCTISFRWQTNQVIARSWHCQEHSAILLYTAESTCSFCLEHFPYYPGKRRRATNGVLVAKNFSGGGWSSRIGWRRILYTDASPTSQDKRRIAPARPT